PDLASPSKELLLWEVLLCNRGAHRGRSALTLGLTARLLCHGLAPAFLPWGDLGANAQRLPPHDGAVAAWATLSSTTKPKPCAFSSTASTARAGGAAAYTADDTWTGNTPVFSV